MLIAENRLRRIIRNVIREVAGKSMKFGFKNVSSLSPEVARELLENTECFDDIISKSEMNEKTVLITDERVKLPYNFRGFDSVSTHFVILEYDRNVGWSIMWRYADNANWNYSNDIRSYISGKIIYRGCELNRPKVIEYINNSGYVFDPSKDRA